MNCFEFELRYASFSGLSHKFQLGREERQLIDLVKISDQGVPDRKIQEISPDELKTLTLQTYTSVKKSFLNEFGSQPLAFGSLQAYIDRLEYELKVIKEMGFNTYILIVADYVQAARKMEIVVGPGRGSGAGSLLAWCVGITDIDPLQYNLLFERFLNPARVTMPDFDIDFEDNLREKVIEYVIEKYGIDKVCAIGTFMKMATKAAFKDVARTLGMTFDISNKISELLPSKKVLDAINGSESEFDELRGFYHSDETVKKAIDFGSKLEGNLRQLGVHACGVIIAPEPVTTYTAVQNIDKVGKTGVVSHYDGHDLEALGLLKMDFLGLRNLSVIKNGIKIVLKRWEKGEGEMQNIKNTGIQETTKKQQEKDKKLFDSFIQTMQFYPDITDVETFERVFKTGDTTGIFQFESAGMRNFLAQLEPDNINDLVAMNALYRPGPMEFIPTYIKRKHGEEKIDYMLPELKALLLDKYDEKVVEEEKKKLTEDLGPIMDITYGIAVYQEQLMFLVQAMAGFSLPEADLLRRGVGKKIAEIIEKLKKEFIDRSQSHRDYKPETALIIYERMIEPAASYSFNKSHSVCYANIAYQTGYLKAHYPLEFYAALMRSIQEDTDKLAIFIQEAQQHGFQILLPHINHSFAHVAAIGNDVRLGFLSIKGIGYEVAKTIEQERKNGGDFASLEDFCERCKDIINKKTLESLTSAGALDGLVDRQTLLKQVKVVLDRTSSSKDMGGGLFGAEIVDTSIAFPKKYQTGLEERLTMDFAMYKTFVQEHLFDGLYPYFKRRNFISQLKSSEEFGQFVIFAYIKKITRAKKKGFYIMLEDVTDSIEFFVKDKLNFKEFDVLKISGNKNKYFSPQEIIKTTVEKLQQQAKNSDKFDPKWTVARVKAERK